MVVNSVKVYARIKKVTKSKEKFYVLKKSGEYEDIILYKHETGQNQASRFRFHGIFDEMEKQSDFFDMVAKPVVTSVLQGFNGTIFAYGQTGSGKTYTMTGSTNKYEERGVIQRCLQHIFWTNEKAEDKPTIYISYMEIYNEIAYDLLNPRESKTAISLEELSRVTVLEDKKGEAHLRNLSVLAVSTEEEAMRLLFLGETNRAIAETPLNEYSSRSHCIFTIYITSRLKDSKSFTYSKLNLVDLAGSERVHRSNITGNLLNEAKHINLSLHFLQQVILALSESRRTHIPFRNSLMTFILKDSLAGNCLTVMIATLDMSRKNIQETISTCKFSQRVSLIRTEPAINEVTDPSQEIIFLKNEIQELRKQLSNKNPTIKSQQTVPLSTLQKQEIKTKLEIYLNNDDHMFKDEVHPTSFQYYLSVLKDKIRFFENELKGRKCEDTFKKTSPAIMPNNRMEQGLCQLSIKEEMLAGNDSSEVDFYLDLLTRTYEKAKFISQVIKESQVNISYIRERLDAVSRTENLKKKITLRGELEYQQKIYRNSLTELKELKNETLQLEAGLAKAKAKLLRQLDNQKCVEHFSRSSQTNNYHENYISEQNDEKQNCTERRRLDKHLKAPHFVHEKCYLDNSCHCSFSCTEKGSKFSDDLYLDSRTGNHLHRMTNYPEAQYCKCDINTNQSFGENSFLPPIHGGSSIGNNYFMYEAGPLSCCGHEFQSQKHQEYIPVKQNQLNATPNPKYDGLKGHLKSGYQCGVNPSMYAKENYVQNLCHFSLCSRNYCDGADLKLGELPHFKNDVLNSQIQLVPNKLSEPYLQKINQHSPVCQEKPHLLDKHLPCNNIKMQECNIDSQNDLKILCQSNLQLTVMPANISNRVSDRAIIPDTLNCQESLDDSSNDKEIPCCVDKDKCVSDELSGNSVMQNYTYDIFLPGDTQEFKQFMNNITLTGDEEVDREICNFYRSKKLC